MSAPMFAMFHSDKAGIVEDLPQLLQLVGGELACENGGVDRFPAFLDTFFESELSAVGHDGAAIMRIPALNFQRMNS